MEGNEQHSNERRSAPHDCARADHSSGYSKNDLIAISRILMQLKSSNSAMRALEGASVDNRTEDIFSTAFRIKREMGYALPLSSHNQSVSFDSDFYSHNSTIVCQLAHCAKLGTGEAFFNSTLRLPEGRHTAFPKILSETMSCLRMSGWQDESEKHIFRIITGLDRPRGGRDKLVRRFTELLFTPPTDRLSEEALLETYRVLLGGNAPFIVEFLKGNSILENTLEALQKFVVPPPEKTESLHPILRAIFAFQMVLALHPFPVANVLMGRILFSWVACRNGYPLLALAPIAGFIGGQQGHRDSEPGTESPANALFTYEGTTDWTLWVERVLELLNTDLERFIVKLNDLRLKRDRFSELLSADGTYNSRQKSILLETAMHDDAEFTYASIMDRFGVAYATAYDDLGKLESGHFLKAAAHGKTTVFIADDGFYEHLHRHFAAVIPDEYQKYYGHDGTLNDDYLAMRDEQVSRLMDSGFPDTAFFSMKYPRYNSSRLMTLMHPSSVE